MNPTASDWQIEGIEKEEAVGFEPTNEDFELLRMTLEP